MREGLGQFCAGALEIRVVTLPLAGHEHAHNVVEIVRPDCVESPAAQIWRAQDDGIVPLVFSNDESTQVVHRRRDLRQDMPGGRVDDGVGGIEPKAVDVKFAHPIGCVFEKESAHRVGSVIESRAPGSFAPWLRVITVMVNAHVVSVWAQMVIDDVKNHGDTVRMRCIHQGAQIVRRTVGPRGRI